MTKRQLGITLVLLGLGASLGLFLIDQAGATRFGGVGPLQRVAMLGSSLMVLVGLTLIPLGDRPA